MSDYPATPSYGMGYGAQDQTNPPYLPPTYPNQYLQPDDGRMGQAGMPSSYDASMSAYGYGGAAPTFSASAVASGVPPLPIFQGWNQDPVSLPPYAPAHAVPQYSGYPNGGHQNSQYYAPPAQHAYQQPQSTSRPYDEGELSDGEFESNGNHANNGRTTSAYGTNQYRGNDGPNYVDAAQRSAFSGGREQNPQPSYNSSNNYNYRDSPQMRAQQSDAYSPYDSPRPTDQVEQVNPNQNYNSYAASHHGVHMNGATQNQHGRLQDNGTNSSTVASHTNGRRPSINGGPVNHNSPSNSAPTQRLPSPLADPPSYTAFVEARKKAQNAVINLYPLSIRFQTYVDEGMGEAVGPLFDELGFSREAAHSVGDATENQLASAPRSSMEENGISQPVPLSTLANGKQPTKNGSFFDRPSAVPATSTAAAAKPTGMTDKEKTLQSKMDALRKSREERAQKAAAKNSAKSPTNPISSTPAQMVHATPSSAPVPTTNTLSTVEKPAAPPLQPQTSNLSASAQSPKPIVTTQPQGPMIPGLFLASTAASPAPSMTTQSPVLTQTNQRKRPVAADFDTPASTPFKRPFGQTRNERPLVIDVSDEEPDSDDEDVAMDLESQADQDSPIQSSRKLSDQRSLSLQNMPPLTDFSNPKHYTPPSNSSAPGTPPVPQQVSKAAIGRPEVLQRKESEIAELKKKIAEAQARKKARQTPSGTRTPRTVEIPAAEAKDTAAANANLASKVEASMKMQQLIDVAENKVSSDQQKLVEAQAAKLQKATELSRNEAERKRLRREKLATDLPLVDAEVQQSQTKLEQLKAEIARLEAEVNKNLEAKRAMAEEMERLGQETEDQLQAQKEKLQDLTQEETVSSDGPTHKLSSNSAERIVEPSPPRASPAQALPSESRQSDNPPADVSVNGDTQVQSPIHGPIAATAIDNAKDISNIAEPSNVTAVSQIISDPQDRASTDRSLDAALQEAAHAQADSHGQEGSDIEIETFAPDPTQLTPDSASNSGEEEVDSPVYSPVLDRTIAETDAESDNYEPPEATPPVDGPFPVESPPFSPAPPESVSQPAIVDDSIQVVDESAQSDTEDRNGSIPQLIQANSEENLNKVPLFTPYESPLKTFRAFRFHPDYKQQVPGGLKSLTYNHKINPTLEFCRYELAGGVCNDKDCEFQHFRDIGLPDDAVLTALGSPEEFSAEQRDRFCQGLRGVLTDLRARKIKDFDVIAAEIVAHRSKFLGDNSKILNLEGTTI